MSGHAKGPWKIDPSLSVRVIDYANTTIAIAGMASRVMENAIANARLIAAAPDMLEALNALLQLAKRDHLRWGPAVADAEAAIAKATGGGE